MDLTKFYHKSSRIIILLRILICEEFYVYVYIYTYTYNVNIFMKKDNFKIEKLL